MAKAQIQTGTSRDKNRAIQGCTPACKSSGNQDKHVLSGPSPDQNEHLFFVQAGAGRSPAVTVRTKGVKTETQKLLSLHTFLALSLHSRMRERTALFVCPLLPFRLSAEGPLLSWPGS